MAKVLLDAGDVYVAASAATILGNVGSETVKVQDGVSVTVDSSVERIEFTRAASAYTYKTTPTGMQVLYNSSVIANVAGGQKLAFTDGSALVQIGAFDPVKLTAPITLGGVTISSTASSIVPSLNTATGEASTIGIVIPQQLPTITLGVNTTSVDEGASITLTVTSNLATSSALSIPYTLSGTGITTSDFNNATSLTGIISIPVGQQTGTLVLNVNNDTTTEGSETITATLGTSNANYNVKTGSVSIVVADTSTTPVQQPTTTNLSSSLTTGTGTVSVDTFNIASGNYSATIAGFAAGDKLNFFQNAAITVKPDTNQSDGIQVVEAADAVTSATTTITLTGLTAEQDNNLFNFSSFNSVFGAGTVA